MPSLNPSHNLQVTLTAGPGGVSSSTWAQMLRILRRCEKRCSTRATRGRSPRAAQGSSTFRGAAGAGLLSSSPAQGLRMHLGAAAREGRGGRAGAGSML